jgi:hypothetical protein
MSFIIDGVTVQFNLKEALITSNDLKTLNFDHSLMVSIAKSLYNETISSLSTFLEQF